MSSEFWQMGGYGFFIWGSFAAALLVYLWMALAPRLRRRQLLSEISEMQDEPGDSRASTTESS